MDSGRIQAGREGAWPLVGPPSSQVSPVCSACEVLPGVSPLLHTFQSSAGPHPLPLTWLPAVTAPSPPLPFLPLIPFILLSTPQPEGDHIPLLLRTPRGLPFHQSPTRPHRIWRPSPQTSVSSPQPLALHCSHTGLLTAPHKHQASTCPRAFALAVPSPGTPLSDSDTAQSLSP